MIQIGGRSQNTHFEKVERHFHCYVMLPLHAESGFQNYAKTTKVEIWDERGLKNDISEGV